MKKITTTAKVTDIELNIKDEIHQYEVEAVICHHGHDNNGHYTWWSNNIHSWTRHSDSHVEIRKQNPNDAYIILMKRKTWRE